MISPNFTHAHFSFFPQEYPERSEQSDIVHNIDLVDSFDKALIHANTELVRYSSRT